MKRQYQEVLGHFAFWVIIVFTYALSEFGYSHSFAEALLYETLFLPVRVITVYINWFILIPRILYSGKGLVYLLVLAGTLFLFSFGQRLFAIYWAVPRFFPQWISSAPDPWNLIKIFQNLIIIAAPIAFSTGIRIFLDWNRQKTRSQILEKEKLSAELKYLRSQINPHFLFNTLNNLYGLSREKSHRVPGLLLKLSDFLSYALYENQHDESTLQKEIDLVEDYLALELARHDDRIKLIKDFPLIVDPKIKAPSFLLIPLVENAFKHGAREETGIAEIGIHLTLVEGWIYFTIKNTLPQDNSNGPKTNGIGLTNLRRRLDILYEHRYQLQTEQTSTHYEATLKLQTK